MTFEMKMKEERKEGIKEGALQAKKQNAIEMLKLNLPVAMIHTVTKLSMDVIRQLAVENNITVKA